MLCESDKYSLCDKGGHPCAALCLHILGCGPNTKCWVEQKRWSIVTESTPAPNQQLLCCDCCRCCQHVSAADVLVGSSPTTLLSSSGSRIISFGALHGRWDCTDTKLVLTRCLHGNSKSVPEPWAWTNIIQGEDTYTWLRSGGAAAEGWRQFCQKHQGHIEQETRRRPETVGPWSINHSNAARE